MLKGKLILRTDQKPNRYGERSVMLQYSTQSVPVRMATGVKVQPELWLGDTGKETVYIRTGKNGHPKGDILNRQLHALKMRYDQKINSLLTDPRQVMTVEKLRSVLNGSYDEETEAGRGKVPFTEHVLNYQRERYEAGKCSFSLWKNTRCYMDGFRRFLRETRRKDTVFCRDVDVELIQDYVSWRRAKGNSPKTINHTLTPIVKTLEKAVRKGWVDRDVVEEIRELYQNTDSLSLKNPKEEDIHYLTTEEMKRLMEIVRVSKYPRTRELVDLFLFSASSCGLRFSDVCTLRWREVDWENGIIRHPQVKNHTRKTTWLTLPISAGSRKILERWKGKHEDFVFGQLPMGFDLDDVELLNKTLNARNRTVNQCLEMLGEKLSLPFRLHFHVARHTFASISLNNGVDLKTISTLMGHSSILTTEKVYAKLFPETLKTEMDEKLDICFED